MGPDGKRRQLDKHEPQREIGEDGKRGALTKQGGGRQLAAPAETVDGRQQEAPAEK